MLSAQGRSEAKRKGLKREKGWFTSKNQTEAWIRVLAARQRNKGALQIKIWKFSLSRRIDNWRAECHGYQARASAKARTFVGNFCNRVVVVEHVASSVFVHQAPRHLPPNKVQRSQRGPRVMQWSLAMHLELFELRIYKGLLFKSKVSNHHRSHHFFMGCFYTRGKETWVVSNHK